MTFFGYLSILLCACFVYRVTGSAWLQDPPSRSAAWYYQIKSQVNYNFRNLDCGGVPVKIENDGGRNCGLCGDPYTDPLPRPNEFGGKYANPRIRTRYYEAGQIADISIWNNLPGSPGFYEFRLCDTGIESQACFDRHLLTIVDHEGISNSTQMSVPKTQGLNVIHVQLPVGVQCNFCVLQWRFRKENSAEGCDNSNWCGVGRGPQLEYYNCADFMIGAVGQPKPDFIQDPTYSDADYGSAYDIATTRPDQGGTTPDGSNIGGATTTRRNIVTIPTAFPTANPVTTSAPVTQPNTPTSTTQAPGPATTSSTIVISPTTERLVLDFSGNPIGSTFGGGSSGRNNAPLVFLLGILPIIGAMMSRNNNQPLPIPPAAPHGFWTQNIPLSNMYLGTNYGFGNFGSSGGYGSGDYGKKSGGYGSGSYGGKGANVDGLGYNNKNVLSGGGPGFVQQGTHLNNDAISYIPTNSVFNTGGTFVQNPIVWNHGGGVSINNGFNNHVIYPRSTTYQHSDNVYGSSNSGLVPNPFPIPSNTNSYQPTDNSPGYAPHPISPKFPPPQPPVFQKPQTPTFLKPQPQQPLFPQPQQPLFPQPQQPLFPQPQQNFPQPQPNFPQPQQPNFPQQPQFPNPQSQPFPKPQPPEPTILRQVGNPNINGIGTGQVFPKPTSIPPPMQTVFPPTNIPNTKGNNFQGPGIESASRFIVSNPQIRVSSNQPWNTLARPLPNNRNLGNNNGNSFNNVNNNNNGINRQTWRGTNTGNGNWNTGNGNGGGFINRPNVGQQEGFIGSPETYQVNDWYSMLMERFPTSGSRAL